MEKVEAKLSQTADNRTPAQIAYDKVQEQRVSSPNYLVRLYNIITQFRGVATKNSLVRPQEQQIDAQCGMCMCISLK